MFFGSKERRPLSKLKVSTPLVILSALMALLVCACESVPKNIPEDLKPIEYFQLAQTEAGKQYYNSALVYYNTFIERFPDDVQRVAEAEFEIAFLYYKKNDLQTAKTLFTELLDKYEQPGGQLLPAWPRILSEKLLITIEDRSLRK